jgi:hypothetical protein
MTRFLTRDQIVDAYPIKRSQLDKLAADGDGPPFRFVSGQAVYSTDDVEGWLLALPVVGGAGAPPLPPSAPKRGRPRKTIVATR